jgi:hypothetical protein
MTSLSIIQNPIRLIIFRFFLTIYLQVDAQPISSCILNEVNQPRPTRIFIYEAKQNRRISFKGSTMILYSDFEKDYTFPLSSSALQRSNISERNQIR